MEISATVSIDIFPFSILILWLGKKNNKLQLESRKYCKDKYNVSCFDKTSFFQDIKALENKYLIDGCSLLCRNETNSYYSGFQNKWFSDQLITSVKFPCKCGKFHLLFNYRRLDLRPSYPY